jgi:hypothetical protein
VFVAAVVVDISEVCDTRLRSVGWPLPCAADPSEGYREPATGGDSVAREAWTSEVRGPSDEATAVGEPFCTVCTFVRLDPGVL